MMPTAAAPAAASATAPHGPFNEPRGMVFCCDTVPSFLPLGSSTSQSMRMLCLPPLASADFKVTITAGPTK